MATDVLKVEKRDPDTKSYLKNLRREGKLPGVFYMHGTKTVPILLDLFEFRQKIHHKVNLFNLDFGLGENKPGIIREIQYDPITGEIIHVDLMGVKASEKIEIRVPLNLVGTPVGVIEEGGILEFVSRELEILCLPKDIPTGIDVDVSNLKMGGSITASEIPLENMELVSDEDLVIALVSAPRVEEEARVVPEVAEGEAVAEPRVITAKESEKKEE